MKRLILSTIALATTVVVAFALVFVPAPSVQARNLQAPKQAVTNTPIGSCPYGEPSDIPNCTWGPNGPPAAEPTDIPATLAPGETAQPNNPGTGATSVPKGRFMYSFAGAIDTICKVGNITKLSVTRLVGGKIQVVVNDSVKVLTSPKHLPKWVNDVLVSHLQGDDWQLNVKYRKSDGTYELASNGVDAKEDVFFFTCPV